VAAPVKALLLYAEVWEVLKLFKQKKFCLTDDEYEKIKKWSDEHECCARAAIKASSYPYDGEITIEFTPTHLGTFVTARCICGSKMKLEKL